MTESSRKQVKRLQEGRGGTVTRTAPNTYLYEVEVFDCNELLPWIRTFTGRILALECSDQSVVRQFYRDLQSVSIRVAAGKSVIIIELFLPPERCDIREHALQRFKLFRCKEQADAGCMAAFQK